MSENRAKSKSKGKGKCLPIGLDLGSSGVKMVQFREFEEGLELTAAAKGEVSEADPIARLEHQAAIAREFIRKGDFKGKR